MSTVNEEETTKDTENRVLLHLMVVAFHHKKGCLVEYCYPPIDASQQDQLLTPSSESSSNELLSSSENETIKEPSSVAMPSAWHSLPSLAIPDGAHNHESDTVFFHLPDLRENSKTVYCVACYRQIATKDLRVRTPDMTRSSVQKSVVALLRLPFYGLVEHKLEIVTRVYFSEGDFSKVDVLEDSYQHLNRLLKPSMLHTKELMSGLSVRNLFVLFGSQVLTLFKLLLLERKTIFITSPIRDLTVSILTLCSLVPGLVQEGLTHSVIPFNIKSEDSTNNVCSKQSTIKVPLTSASKSKTTVCDNRNLRTPTTSLPNTNTVNSHWYITKQEEEEKNNETSVGKKATTTDQQTSDLEKFVKQNPREQDQSAKLENVLTYCSSSYTGYGFPLQIFAHTASSYLMPYFSITHFDVLNNERVRSCWAGSSNQVFCRWENDIDVFVMDDHLEIEDALLKRILKPSVEDCEFMSFLLRTVLDPSELPNSVDIFDESQHEFYEGSDEWIRCHFKNYLLHMMRCSLLDDSSREYRAFNPAFMSAWKSTHNYKLWSANKDYTNSCLRDIDPQHPFSGNRMNNLKLKLTNIFQNRQDYLNQTLNKVAIGSAINSARSTVNSWLSNLGNTLQDKTVVSTWNSYIGRTDRSLQSAQQQKQQESSSSSKQIQSHKPKQSSSTSSVVEPKQQQPHSPVKNDLIVRYEYNDQEEETSV